MRHTTPRAVLFDWDGTLIDSAAATYHCYRQLFESFGLPFDGQRFRESYSPDWYQTYRMVGLPDADWQEADARWLEAYERQRKEPVEGAAQVLEQLAADGILQGLVTSGDRGRVTRELRELSFARYFSVLVCAGDAPRKPAPDPLLAALRELGVPAGDAAFVGDSPEDILMARAAGVFVVAVPGGFPNRHLLAAARPDRLAESLPAALDVLLDRSQRATPKASA
jgi:HAD superfamily hydrolase (TIGR01509 family)